MRRWGVAAVVIALGLGLAACGDDDNGETGEHAAAPCERVGDGNGSKVAVALDEWTVAAEPATAPAGPVTFAIDNEGEHPHELVVVKVPAPSALKVTDGKVDEEALPAGAFIGEVEAFPAGDSCEGTFELTAGKYQLFCNIVEEHDGEPESHFENGMVTAFAVA
jgi:hypothetical protein